MLRSIFSRVRYFKQVRSDPQYRELKKIVEERPGRMTLVTQFRGSRKSFLAHRLCLLYPKYIFISNQWEFRRLIELGMLRTSSVLLRELKRHLWDLFVLACVVTACRLLWWYVKTDTLYLRDAFRKWCMGQDKDMLQLRAAVTKWYSEVNLLQEILTQLSVYSVLVACITIFSAVRASRSRTIILDDVLEFASKRDEVQTLLTTAASLADRHRVVLLSSNEGILNCFRDRCSTVYNQRVLPAPTTAALATILQDVVPHAALTAEQLAKLTRRVPSHLALSIRFHKGAVERSETLLPALLADSPLTLADTVALFETVMEIDLESDQNFRSLALIHSPPYESVPGGIQLPKVSVPRRLAVTCAVVDLCQRLEQRCILDDICDVLKVAISTAMKRFVDGRVTYVPAVAEERRHAEQMSFKREQLQLQREQLELQREQHRETLELQKELSVMYWFLWGIRKVLSTAPPTVKPSLPTPTPTHTRPPGTSAPEPTPTFSPCDEAVLRLHSVFPRGTPVMDTLHSAAQHELCCRSATVHTVDEEYT